MHTEPNGIVPLRGLTSFQVSFSTHAVEITGLRGKESQVTSDGTEQQETAIFIQISAIDKGTEQQETAFSIQISAIDKGTEMHKGARCSIVRLMHCYSKRL